MLQHRRSGRRRGDEISGAEPDRLRWLTVVPNATIAAAVVDFGVHLWGPQPGDTVPENLAMNLAILRACEGALTSLWVSDHLQYEDGPTVEGWTHLTYLAALNPSYLVGHLVLAQSFRNP